MSVHEVFVTSRDPDEDPLAHQVQEEAARVQGVNLGEVRTGKIFRLEGVTDEEAGVIADRVLIDPIVETGFVLPTNWRVLGVEVAYKPGVMNPEAASIMKAANDLGIYPEAADSSQVYAFQGDVDPDQIDSVVDGLLMNEKVQQEITESPKTLKFAGEVGPVDIVPVRDASDEELMALSKDKLFLDRDEMNVIKEHFTKLGRDPTDVELEIVAARWSEHCGHKTFNAKVIVDGVEKEPLYTRIKNAANANYKDLVVSAFEDNSGVIKFYDGQAICGKVETHNSPSAIEPYGGAATGSGGVFRDIMGTGQGAKTIISTDMFCFAPPDIDEAMLPPGTLSPDYIQRRVVQGVGDYGNRMGIPTANGSIHYHEDFRAKPTVIVGAYGILPEALAQKGTPEVGDKVVVIGGRTGRDGLHGATFSSGEMTERTATVNSSAVQIGNAIEEKRMFDALLEARDRGLIRALTDCGAAGFSSAIGEIGEDTGVTVDISRAPLKYPGLAPWEIWLSESQERMVAAIPADMIDEFMAISQKYNVESTVLGEFDGSQTLTVNYGDETVAELDYEFLANGLPQRVMHAHWEREVLPEITPEQPQTADEWIDRLKAVLSHGNVCSKEPVVRQYDHGVQGGNIVPPFGGIDQSGPNDALVIRPILDKPYGVVLSHGMNPILNRIDPLEGTKWGIAEAASNYVAVGGNLEEAAAVGNYIWPFPDEEAMGSLDRSADAAVEMMHQLGLPVISGKDSLSSTYRGNGEVIKIPPVYTMSIFGRIPDVEMTMTSEIKDPGNSTLYLIGKTSQGMAGSTYYDVLDGSSNHMPIVDTKTLTKTLKAIQSLVANNKVLACHDVSEGGVVTAIAEMCFGSNGGAEITVPNDSTVSESYLFSETAGCFVVEIPNDINPYLLEELKGVEVDTLGRTTEQKRFAVQRQSAKLGRQELFNASVAELKQAWQQPMKEIFHA